MLPHPKDNDRRRNRFFPILLVAAVIVAFAPLVTADFTSWDDGYNIWQNPRLNPPTLRGVAYYWTTPAYGLYVPLTYTVWAALAKLAYLEQPDPMGSHLNPWVFHAASIALHAASVLIVYAILRRLVRNPRAACLGAMLFGLHPVQVEPVGWAAGMKDVLSGTLALAAVWQYVEYAADASKREHRYALGLVLFILAMLAKPSAMVVPVIAGAIDLLLLRRAWRSVVLALTPWMILSIACAILASQAQPATGVTPAPLWARPLIAADAVAFYLYKLVWPVGLAIDYGRRPAVVIERGWIWFTWIVPAILALVLIRYRRRAPELLAAAVVFVAGVAPVVGLRTFLFQHFSTTADHYLYVAMLGPALAVAWLVKRFPSPRVVATVSLVLVLLAVRTMLQTRMWRDDVALFTRTLQVNPDSFVAMNNLGMVWAQRGEIDRAQPLFERAVQLEPDYFDAHQGLAEVFRRRDQPLGAVEHQRRALEIMRSRPPAIRRDIVPLLTTLARDLLAAGDTEQARRYLEEARAIRPNDPDVIETERLLNERRAAP